jgi:hypothetical protein
MGNEAAMTTLADRLLPDALWQRIQPLLPPAIPRPRRCTSNRLGPGLHGRDPVHGGRSGSTSDSSGMIRLAQHLSKKPGAVQQFTGLMLSDSSLP